MENTRSDAFRLVSAILAIPSLIGMCEGRHLGRGRIPGSSAGMSVNSLPMYYNIKDVIKAEMEGGAASVCCFFGEGDTEILRF